MCSSDLDDPSTCSGCEIWFLNDEGKLVSKKLLDAKDSWQQILVPKEAIKFGVFDSKSNMQYFPIPNDDKPLIVEIGREYSPWKDFRRGLGDYNLKSYDSVIKYKSIK